MEETIQNPQLPNPNLNPQPVEEPKSNLSALGGKVGLVGGSAAGLVRSFNKRKTIGIRYTGRTGSGAWERCELCKHSDHLARLSTAI